MPTNYWVPKSKGVRYNPSSKMYYVRKQINGKVVYLGSTTSLRKAQLIYKEGKKVK